MKKIILAAILGGMFVTSNAQIKVGTNNRVGIGEQAPVSLLSVNDPGTTEAAGYFKNNYTGNSGKALHAYNYQSSSTWGFGIYANINNTSTSASYLLAIKASAYSSANPGIHRTYGVFGVTGGGANGYNYGLYGQILGTRNGAAIFASTPGKYDVYVGGIWAGYFRGDVYIEEDLDVENTLWVSGVQVTSDIRLKENVTSMRSTEGEMLNLTNILQLNPISYKLLDKPLDIPQEVLDTMSVEAYTANTLEVEEPKTHFGLSAQELEIVYPELVLESKDGYKSVNYIGLIPILIESTREQQYIIQKQQDQIDLIKQELENLKAALKSSTL